MKPKEFENQSEQERLSLDQPSSCERPNFGEEFEPQRIPEIKDERLAKALREIKKGYDPSAHLETQLMLEGLLPRLEQAGILPIIENPNPYDPVINEAQHENWWEEHPYEGEIFERTVDKRNEVLRHLYIGALIGSGPWNIP